ncbi:chromate transporter, chromate ion transporter (CHR) family [Emticicia oligotrophica DSM 17448]|uniref:Chromate transporter, chromate ion transporter (CHR) family n=1 Tax=Emticicia oligotrophica (strain DSM 17448 / CIP 109782 / MTCC 6937 / GPTSA100-15) TaxID=929562 RepID=A0ABN4AQC4_EMTOG|nr:MULTISPECIES: chromate efflux transporter [Emticicia]AFK04583.1 chromate transporter, chromate ion transporter (CHR) family [Emticicia oligotrophica DSM 17448]
MTKTRQIRYIIFLKDVLILALTCFGGPQVHLTMFLDRLVRKHNYISEAEILELQALCQVLPGPTSTQTITAIGFRLGGPSLAYLTLLVWVLPGTILMTLAALGVSFVGEANLINITRFIKPMGVAFIIFATYAIGSKVIKTKTSVVLMLFAAIAAYIFHSPYITPIWILLGGLATSLKFGQQEKMEKQPIKIEWGNFFIWLGVLLFAVVLGKLTHSLPIRLFENFYRNGSLAFGGGHILKPLLYNEFVEFKHYLSPDEFLSGVALVEVAPGPVFSISAFVGALSMRNWGMGGEILGSAMATLGIFLPGIFLIFFVIRFWEQLKKYRGIRASLEGINAASTGLTAAAALSLFQPMATDVVANLTVIFTLILLQTRLVPTYLIILGGLFLGWVIA